jgi:1,4-dihydroxy-2-naphthoate octaprenyltransferase
VLGARPRTLPAAVVPVLVGTACGWWLIPAGSLPSVAFTPAAGGIGWTTIALERNLIWWRALAALVVALAVQVGTNYANDYADGVRGTDDERVGPVRLVASGLATPGEVRRASLVAFGVAGAAGLALAAATSWWLLLVGAACFLAGWFYTGGPRPYGYLGLGEVFVFVFFGLVATVGSSYVQHPWLKAPDITAGALAPAAHWWLPILAAVPVGLLAAALLEANNLRDLSGDRVAGKKTVAVRLGRVRAGWAYVVTLGLTAVGIGLVGRWRPWAFVALAALPLAVRPVTRALSADEGPALLPLLAETARLQIVAGLLLAVGILV